MRTSGWLFEIIVVDDGSTDETGPLALADGIRVLRNRRIRRYGASFVRSIAAARYERILIIDADDSSSCS